MFRTVLTCGAFRSTTCASLVDYYRTIIRTISYTIARIFVVTAGTGYASDRRETTDTIRRALDTTAVHLDVFGRRTIEYA